MLEVNEKVNYQWDIDNPLGYNNSMGRYKQKKHLHFLKRTLRNKTNLNILDIGGGSGRIAWPLKQMQHDVTVVDLSTEAVEIAKSKGLKAFNTSIDDFEGKGYDAATCFEVLSYIPDDEKFFRKVNLLLKKRGSFIFTIKNSKCIYTLIGKLMGKRQKDNGLYYHTVQRCIKLAKLNGFKIKVIEGFKWLPFGTASNNKLIPFFAGLENIFLLKLFPRLSPHVIFHIVKE